MGFVNETPAGLAVFHRVPGDKVLATPTATPFVITSQVPSGALIAIDTDALGAVTVTLEASPRSGRDLQIKNVGTAGNLVTLSRNGNLIDRLPDDLQLPGLTTEHLVFHPTLGWLLL